MLDTVDGIDEFIEIERDVAAENIERARDRARDVLCELGLDPDEHIRTAYLDLKLNTIMNGE